jgi:hypothetical protein
VERNFLRKLILWQFFHLLSTSKYISHSNPLVTPVAIRSWTIPGIICSVLQVVTDIAASGSTGICIRVLFSWAPLFVYFPPSWSVWPGRPCW